MVVGRTLLPSSETEMTYEEAMELVFQDEIPWVTQADIGHTEPCMTLILGAIAELNYDSGKAQLHFEMRE